MKVIGITGPTGAGKTTALQALRELGAEVLDADAVYREMLKSHEGLQRALVDAFGQEIMDEGGHITTRRIARVAYPDRMEELSALTHPFVLEEIAGRIAGARERGLPAVAIDAIALVESGAVEQCDAVVAVLAPLDVRIRRIMARDNIDEAYARQRIAAQQGDEFFRAHADYVLENDGAEAPSAFGARAKTLFEKILAG